MSAREEMDQKNLKAIEVILQDCPKIIRKYLDSLSRKTTYTKKAYAYYIKDFFIFVDNELGYDTQKNSVFKKIKPMDIDSYMEHIRFHNNGTEKSATYRRANLAAINGFFKFLMINNMINKNPCELVEVPRDNKIHEIVTITDEDMEIMLNNIKKGTGTLRAKRTQRKWQTRDIALLRLGVSTGLRISAICNIDLDDINFKERYIIVTEKGKKDEKIFIGANTTRALMTWIEDRKKMVDDSQKALFISRGGNRITDDVVQIRFKQIAEGTGKNITPHKMRATCATRLYEETGDIYLVQQQLGHKNIENTKRYTKVGEKDRQKAAAILDRIY